MNLDTSVNIITTDDLEPGVDLTSLFHNNLEMIHRLGETAILNNSGSVITTTDCYGVVTTHSSKRVMDNALEKLKLSHNFRGIVIVEKRSMNPSDLGNTLEYYNKMEKKYRLQIRVERIQNKLLSVSNRNRLREYYLIYTIPIDYLRLEKSVSIRSAGLVISLPGYEGKAILLEDMNGEVEVDSNSYGLNITYYSREMDTLYMNILGSVVRLDSTPPIDGVELGIVLYTIQDGNTETVIIKPEDYSKHNIYRTLREAKYNMSTEDLLATKKVDLEFMKTESSFINNILTDTSNLYKIRMDLSSKVLNSMLERDKYMKLQQVKQQSSGPLDHIKKIVDILSMIKKIM